MEKAYYSLTEVCEILGVKAHIIRYWESEFPKLKENSDRNTRRRFTAKELELLRKIKDLVQNRRFTLEGAKAELKKRRPRILREESQSVLDIKKELLEIKDILQKRKYSHS